MDLFLGRSNYLWNYMARNRKEALRGTLSQHSRGSLLYKPDSVEIIFKYMLRHVFLKE